MPRFSAATKLSPRQATLSSGTLWLRDAVLARTGTQRYHVSELLDVADAVAIGEPQTCAAPRRGGGLCNGRQSGAKSFRYVPKWV